MDLPEILALMLVVMTVLLLLVLRGVRPADDNPYEACEGSTYAYFETLKHMEPEEGIDYIVSYIQNPKWGCPAKDLPEFLFAMAERNDGYGEAARKKISELGLMQNI